MTARPVKVLKHDETFAVFDDFGDCGRRAVSPEGIYFKDTRFLSKWDLRFAAGRAPLLLSSSHDDDGSALTVTLANPSLPGIPKDLIGVTRTKFLLSGCCHERLSLRNYDVREHHFEIELHFDADFKDLFEVRGTQRSVSAMKPELKAEIGTLMFQYVGLDDIARLTEITFLPAPTRITSKCAHFSINLPPGATTSIATRVRCADKYSMADDTTILSAYRAKRREAKLKCADIATVGSSNDVFNQHICRCTSDVTMLLARTRHGYYPHAGIPWYSTVFGRDGILTALFALWVAPEIAKGVLLHLADTQATAYDAKSDAAPGKILHEQRLCEMASTSEVPFQQYYGTVDATPLFVVLAGEYWLRTGDGDTIRQIWPNITAALQWCAELGDQDGDGFVEYFRQTPTGLSNQGWKDSHDAIFHADGRMAEGPIALVEVQGYVYQAYQHGAQMAEHMSDPHLAERYATLANRLKTDFHAAFWLDELDTYALALDRDKRPCGVVASNAGHLFMGDLVPADFARRCGRVLMGTGMWSGWGVRTLSTASARYNPMSYHNGSIWPHDNAVIALGLARYGMKSEVARIFEGLYAAQKYQTDGRLPELFCGSARRRGRGPVSYPVSCSPQAWAAAAPFALIKACLGMEIDASEKAVRLKAPVLPPMLNDITLNGISVGGGKISLRVLRAHDSVAVDVVSRTGDIEIEVGA
ncbi:MAG: amylo-alpha-1,6-glucosidase [Hyphomicrobium sp.]|nr:amylo-alpha-1,6-glucosidase [Hyphomicrobium sp.]